MIIIIDNEGWRYMRKSSRIIIAVICLFALFACYHFEQKVYEKQTYAYYKKTKEEQLNHNNLENSIKTDAKIEKAMEENQSHINEESKKVAYLTFDDGPSNITKQVLDTLKKYNVNATFFLIGNQITEDTIPIIEEAIAQGNTIGVHTYTHRGDTIYCSAEAYIEDFKKAEQRIYETINIRPKIFRFPWGSANCYLNQLGDDVIESLEKKGYVYYDWNVSAEDSVGKPTEYSIVHNIEKDFKKYTEPIILMHDSAINELSAKVLPKVIEMIQKEGYRFDTLDHMEVPYQYPRD